MAPAAPVVSPESAPIPAPVAAEPPPPPSPTSQPQPLTRIVLDDATLHFANNQAVLPPKSKDALLKVVEGLKGYSGSFDLVVTGFTSSMGSKAHNLVLSRQRAAAVARILVAGGIAAKWVRSVGLGSDQPIANNGARAGPPRNRQMEITVLAADADIRHNEGAFQDVPVPPAPGQPEANP